MLTDNAIRALVEGQGTGNVSFFRFENDRLSTTFEAGDVGPFRDLLREVLDWRLAEFLNRQSPGDSNADVICRVARVGDHPILVLTNDAASLHFEEGFTPVQIDGEAYELSIEENAINVVRKPDEEANLLPKMLRHWFGNDAGLSGNGERVKLKRGPFGFEMEALRIPASQGLQVWARYLREAIAPAFGLTFSQAIWKPDSLSKTRRSFF